MDTPFEVWRASKTHVAVRLDATAAQASHLTISDAASLAHALFDAITEGTPAVPPPVGPLNGWEHNRTIEGGGGRAG